MPLPANELQIQTLFIHCHTLDIDYNRATLRHPCCHEIVGKSIFFHADQGIVPQHRFNMSGSLFRRTCLGGNGKQIGASKNNASGADTICAGAVMEAEKIKQDRSQKRKIISDLLEKRLKEHKLAYECHHVEVPQTREGDPPDQAQASPQAALQVMPSGLQLPYCFEWADPHKYFNFAVKACWRENLSAQIEK